MRSSVLKKACIELFPSSGRGMISFWGITTGTKFQGGTLSAGALNVQGSGRKFAIFDRNRRVSWTRYEIGPWLLWIANKKSWAADRSVSVPMMHE